MPSIYGLVAMYLLFADESGTHGGSHAFVVGGIAIHEQDAQTCREASPRQ